MGSLTDGAETRTLDWVNGRSTTAPTTPLKLALCTSAPTDSAAGTEVAGGSYARQTITPAAASGTSPATATNSADINFTGMPAVGGGGVTHWEIWDSAGTPFRWWWGAFDAAKTTNSGDTFQVAAGQLSLTMD